jgi:5'-methylthioadenosine phosphorylase
VSAAVATIGIIGGSGLYAMEGFGDVREVCVDTPFGKPSDSFMVGTLEGRRVAFLPRHARGHRILPHELNFRANIYALKTLGVERILSVSAVGSLKEKYAPLHMLIPDQFVDRTRTRVSTFFGRGIVGHVGFAHPFCKDLQRALSDACAEASVTHHEGGSYVCIEGPQFSTRAESELYRSWGMDVVGMTNLQEAKLAREAEICYVTLALITDYDCWHPDHDSVTVEQVVAVLQQNSASAKRVLRAAVRSLDPASARRCECAHALKNAIMTAPDAIPLDVKRELQPIIGKYIKAEGSREGSPAT